MTWSSCVGTGQVDLHFYSAASTKAVGANGSYEHLSWEVLSLDDESKVALSGRGRCKTTTEVVLSKDQKPRGRCFELLDMAKPASISSSSLPSSCTAFMVFFVARGGNSKVSIVFETIVQHFPAYFWTGTHEFCPVGDAKDQVTKASLWQGKRHAWEWYDAFPQL